MTSAAPANPADTQAAMLAELAQLGMALARELQARAMAAETTEEAAQAGSAFHKVARTVRQSLALSEKLTRDRARAMREAEVHTDTRQTADRARRRDYAKNIATRLIWTESEREDEDCADLEAEMLDHLEAASLTDQFLEGPFSATVARLCADLGLDPPVGAPRRRPGGGLEDTRPVRFIWEFVDPPSDLPPGLRPSAPSDPRPSG